MSLRGLPLLQDSISRLLAQLHENEPVRLAAATAVGLVVAAKATKAIARLAAEAHDAPEGDGAEHPLFSEYFTNAQGLRIYTRTWRAASKPKALVVIVHGVAEHCGRYARVAEALAAGGYDVGALDHQGHGRSEGTRGHVARMAHYVEDVTRAAEFLRRDAVQPVVLLGHSMGGLVSVHAANVLPNLKGIVLSAPAVVPDPKVATPALKILSRLVSRVLPKCPVKRLPAQLLCRDAAVIAQYNNDPLVYRGALSARWAAEMLDGCDASLGEARRATAPLLVVHGEQDKIVALDGTKLLLANWKGPSTGEIVPGAYHETFNDPCREEVYARIIEWLDATV